jgi:hypothetical protein
LQEDLPNIVGERVPLQQTVMNLVLNAIDAVSVVPERARLSITTEARQADGVLITVGDTRRRYRCEGPGSHPPAIFHDQTARHGDGPFDLSIDRRCAPRPVMGNAGDAKWIDLSRSRPLRNF